ncbi:MAG: hypothetical protein A2493_03215 [Candidatus Magasanikbacteria bacterium RIFOXYC12_FULL_33_11]|uniref:Uncharacterized protein n=1 Tax=Candidatus Magasanikbacteria bacterium RIFOXYC12_FULL_33_11 TaxID=1798701 RepID=A0A1F6NRY5_9BACT|nr:MAG: hypothetical protein A2493_03215 [Candidatus Magasanikbacteria bacterium RIFOXYC12_FULL_33_11]
MSRESIQQPSIPVPDHREPPPGYEPTSEGTKNNGTKDQEGPGVRIIGGDEENDDEGRGGYSTSMH